MGKKNAHALYKIKIITSSSIKKENIAVKYRITISKKSVKVKN